MKFNKNKMVEMSLLLAVAVLPLPSFALDAKPGEIVVQMKKPMQEMQAFALEGGAQNAITSNTLLVKTKNVDKTLNELKKNPDVALAEPNYIYHAENSGLSWYLKNTGQNDCRGLRGTPGIDVRAEEAWNSTRGSKDVLVAVIDTGVDINIPRLKNQIAENETEKNGLPGVDDDQNGYIDDIHGYDFVNKTGMMSDDQGHGTFCASSIIAGPGEQDDIQGLAPGVKLLPVKFLDARGSGSLADAVKAIDYAVKRGAKVLSNSWGGGTYSKILEESIKAAQAQGVLVVAAAGNSGENIDTNPLYPAAYSLSNVIAVAGANNTGALAHWSNFGAKVHLAAPGVNLSGFGLGGSAECSSGTSMATPLVAAVGALMLSKNQTLTAEQLKQKILESVTPLESLKEKVATGGLLNAAQALSGL